MNIINLFSGCEIGREAVKGLGWKVDKWYSSEVDKYAIKIANKNHEDLIQLGDITKWREWDIDWSSIDLILAGSPCQGFSFAGKQLNFNDERSKLFFVFVDILNHVKELNPDVKFMLENVKMKKEYESKISQLLSVEPIFINSSLVSAQERKRLYWSNIPGIQQPKDKKINLIDILEKDLHTCNIGARIVGRRINDLGKREDYNKDIPIIQYLELRNDNKSNCLSTVYKDSVLSYVKTDKRLKIKFNQKKSSCLSGGANSGGNHSDMDILVIEPDICRRYSCIECERLQTLPDNYTEGVSNTQRYKMLGNGWTKDVIKHILSYYKFER